MREISNRSEGANRKGVVFDNIDSIKGNCGVCRRSLDDRFGDMFYFVEYIGRTAFTFRKAEGTTTWLVLCRAFSPTDWTHSEPAFTARFIAEAHRIVLVARCARETRGSATSQAVSFVADQEQIGRSFRAYCSTVRTSTVEAGIRFRIPVAQEIVILLTSYFAGRGKPVRMRGPFVFPCVQAC